MPEDQNARRIVDLEADNLRLRRLLEQRDAPAELRHRLRNTLSLLRSIIRRSAETQREIDLYAAHVEDRLDTLIRTQSMIDELGVVDLHTLILNELTQYDVDEGERFELSGPEIELAPRAGMVMAMAMHELAVNAIEHGAIETPGSRITASWRVEVTPVAPMLVLDWKETGSGSLAPMANAGFGNEVLTKMLPYELRATTTLLLEPDGLRAEIRLPFTEQTGRFASSDREPTPTD